MYCLICGQPVEQTISWNQLLSPYMSKAHVCKPCNEKLELITGDQCRICGRPFSKLPEEYRDSDICHDCYRWEQERQWHGILTKNTSLFYYNEFFKEILAQFKFRGDHELVKLFEPQIQKKFKQMFDQKNPPIIIPIPLSPDRFYERGFNQSSSIAALLYLPIDDILTRTHSEKQSKKSRSERVHKQSPFHLKTNLESHKYYNKDILLIDDIYTTGTTIRQAAKALSILSPKSIYSLTVARS